jgi:hypothetical protein
MIHTDFLHLMLTEETDLNWERHEFVFLSARKARFVHTYICFAWFALHGRVSSILYIATANSLAAGMRT